MNLNKPLNPSCNYVWNVRLKQWIIGPAPLWKQLNPLPKAGREKAWHGTIGARPSQRISPETFVENVKAKFGNDWVSIDDMAKGLKRAHSFLRDKTAECKHLGLMEFATLKKGVEGRRNTMVNHYRVKK